MAKKTLPLTIQLTGTGNGTPVDVSDMVSMEVEVTVGSGTYQVMVSYDGTNFVQAGSNITSTAKQLIDDAALKVRVDCSAFSSGPPAAQVAGKVQAKKVRAVVPAASLPATGSIQDVATASHVDGETVTINDGQGNTKIFEYDVAGDGVAGGHVAVNISAAVSAHDVAVILIAAINGVSGFKVSAVDGLNGLVKLTNAIGGTSGNHTITTTVASGSYAVSGMSGGGTRAGTPVDVEDMKSMTVELFSMGTATYKVMQSMDGTNFLEVGSDFTSAGSQTLSDAALQCRIDCSTYTSGTPLAAVGGTPDQAKRKKSVAAPVTVTTGTAVNVADLISAVVQITGIGSATYKVMASEDGTNFYQVGSNFTSDGSQAIDDAVIAVRVDCSVHSSGTPTAAVAGLLA